MSIRFATEDDLPTLIDMVEHFYNQTPYSKALVFSKDKTLNTLVSILHGSKEDGIILVLADPSPVGLIVASVTEPLCSEGKHATELVWWVNEGYRGRASLELLNAYEYWQEKVGCSGVSMASTQGGSDLDKFYKRRGYTTSEITYYKAN